MNPSLPFPSGNNSSDTIIDTIHFNLITLIYWNYTLYTNSTLSNESNCILVFSPYTPPLLLPNGTFINATSCYVPIKPIQAQGITGLVFGILFAASIVFTLINLRKHGRSFLPREKRWNVVGRRWQWYWMLFVAVCGIISTVTGIDVDRNYLQSTALMLRSFFYTLMLPGMLAAVWEAVRQWTSWQERQICNANPFALRAHDARSRKEFYMPLVFYLFDWLVFFMTIPRPWSAIQKQRSALQAEKVARPVATDARFKAGAVLAVFALAVACYCVKHSIYYYKHNTKQHLETLLSIVIQVPPKLCFSISIIAVRIGYTIASAWRWAISPYRVGVDIPWLYGLGYGPPLLLLTVLNIYGFIEENDDRVLISQRARRNEAADRELGITGASRKPSWWSKSHRKADAHAEEMLREIAFEPSCESITSVTEDLDNDHSGKWRWQREKDVEDETQHQEHDSSNTSTYAYGSSVLDSSSRLAGLRPKRESSATGSEQSMRSWQSRPQVVRSMLNV
jgi:hypothetical protein